MRSGGICRRFIKIIFACIVMIIVTGGCVVCARAAYYEMNLTMGFDNQAKYGRYVPVIIELYSDDDFEGILSINVELANGSEQISSYPVSLSGGESEIIKTYISLYVKNNNIVFSLKNLAGEEVEYKNAKLDIVEDDYTELFVGVLSKNWQMVEMFDNINPGEYSDISFPYILTRSFGLDVDNLWGDYLYTLDCLDIIVVTWDVLTILEKEQIKALIDWGASGKTLIIEYNEYLAANYNLQLEEEYNRFFLESQELEGEEKRIAEEYLASMRRRLPKEPGVLFEEVSKKKQSDDELRPGLWICSADYYEGRIGFIDSGSDRDFYSYMSTNNNALLGLIICKVCTLSQVDEIINYDMYYMNYDDSYDVEYMLNSLHGRDVPNIKEYIIIICVYIVLIGPLLYFVLASLKKQRYLMLCILVLASVFLVIIYEKSEDTRFTNIFLQYANIVDIRDERVDEITYFSANVPYKDTYYMKFDSDYEVKPLMRKQLEERGKDYLEILYDSDDITKITLKKSLPFSKEYFEALNLSADVSEWNIAFDVDYYNGFITGSITNNSGKDLNDTALILFDKIVLLGDIKDKESVRLDTTMLMTMPYYANDVADMIVSDDANGKQENIAKSRSVTKSVVGKDAVAYYVISRYFENKETTPIFVGFASETFELFDDYEAYGYTMLRITADVNTAMANAVFEPIGYENIENKDNNTNYDSYSNTTYSSSVRLQYNFEDRDTLSQIIFSVDDNSRDDTAYYGSFNGQTLFYNYTTLKYDEVDISKEYFDITELNEYLVATEDGGYNLIVQYKVETEGKYRYTETKMPSVSVIRRFDNVKSAEFEEEVR